MYASLALLVGFTLETFNLEIHHSTTRSSLDLGCSLVVIIFTSDLITKFIAQTQRSERQLHASVTIYSAENKF